MCVTWVFGGGVVRDIRVERMQERKVEELAHHLLMLISLVS